VRSSSPPPTRSPSKSRRARVTAQGAEPAGLAARATTLPDIHANAVCPGVIDTESIRRFAESAPGGRDALIADDPIGRLGAPDEIAAAVLRLCSDAASFAIGHALFVDGGQTV
jgi:NAD(P)-dependent dehydrogenase (short-subunit alcohol dehydrogenase family)